jgi:hypothetical protein
VYDQRYRYVLIKLHGPLLLVALSKGLVAKDDSWDDSDEKKTENIYDVDKDVQHGMVDAWKDPVGVDVGSTIEIRHAWASAWRLP